MDSELTERIEQGTASFVTFARALLVRLREWEKESSPPFFEDMAVRFVEQGRRGDIVRKLDYERFLRRRWDKSLSEIMELAKDCVRLHLDSGQMKPPPLVDAQGAQIVAPSFEQILPSLAWILVRPVLATVDGLQTLQVADGDLIDTYRRFAEGWCAADVPQCATVPLLNFAAEASVEITPFLGIVPFTPSDKNLLFSRTAIFEGHRQPDFHANFKLSGQFSNDTNEAGTFRDHRLRDGIGGYGNEASQSGRCRRADGVLQKLSGARAIYRRVRTAFSG